MAAGALAISLVLNFVFISSYVRTTREIHEAALKLEGATKVYDAADTRFRSSIVESVKTMQAGIERLDKTGAESKVNQTWIVNSLTALEKKLTEEEKAPTTTRRRR